MFFKKKIAGIPVETQTISEQLTNIYLRLGKIEVENVTIHDKIDKLEVRTRKDKTQRHEETQEEQPKSVFLSPDGSLIKK